VKLAYNFNVQNANTNNYYHSGVGDILSTPCRGVRNVNEYRSVAPAVGAIPDPMLDSVTQPVLG
jgi:hypothetical protein